MKLVIAVMAAALISGCGATVQTSNPRGTNIQAVGLGEATRMADAECAKHGRYSRFNRELPGFVYSFDCVE